MMSAKVWGGTGQITRKGRRVGVAGVSAWATWVVLSLASSLDGRIASAADPYWGNSGSWGSASGSSGWSSNGGWGSSGTGTSPTPSASSTPYSTGAPTTTAPGGGAGLGSGGGSDGVEFQMIPLDYGSDCNSVLLKATRKYPGTAFVLPKAIVGVDPQRETLFEIIPAPKGQYILRFGLYFPKQNETVKLARGDSRATLKSCDVAAMIAEANRHAASNDQLQWAASLQITGIAVRIDGTAQAYQIGANETALLSYQGVGHIVEFTIPDRESLDLVLRRMTGELGLEINLDFRFAARNSDGRIDAHVDSDMLAKGLRAYLGGAAWIAAADLQVAVGKVLSNLKSQVYMEQSTSADFNTLANNFIGRVIQFDPSAMYNGGGYGGGYGGSGYGSSGWGSSPYGSGGYGSGGYGSGGYGSGSGGWGGYGLAGTGGYADDPNTPPPQGGVGPMIRVGAVFQYLKSKQTADLSAVSLGRNESHSYTTSVLLKASLADPSQATLRLYSMQKSGTTHQQYLKAGTVLHIYPYERSVQKFSTRKETRYYTGDQIRQHALASFFPSLPKDLAKLTLLSPVEGPRSILYVGDPIVTTTTTGGWFNKKTVKHEEPPLEYLAWGEDATIPEPDDPSDSDLILSLANLNQLPVQFSLSEVGPRKFPLAELLASDEYWEGKYDARGARIDVTVKKNLGYLTLWNTEDYSSKETLTRQFFEERWNRQKGAVIQRTEPEAAREAVPAINGRSVLKFKVRLETKDGDSATPGPIQLQPISQPANPGSSAVIP